MLSPNEAFNRLCKDGAFVEDCDNVHIHWYWHSVGNEYKVMARRNLDGNSGSTLYHEFHISEKSPLSPKRYF